MVGAIFQIAMGGTGPTIAMKYGSATKGFTIVELMVTLAVAAILMGFALPAFNDFVRQRTMTTAVNDFVLAVTFARSEAVRRGQQVSVQTYENEADNEWGLGYCVVVGLLDCDDPLAEVLRRFSPLDDEQYTFDATAGVPTTGTLTFSARGMLTPQPPVTGFVELCSTDVTANRGRRVSLSVTGQPDSQDHEDCHA